jgi:hypothetical protein
MRLLHTTVPLNRADVGFDRDEFDDLDLVTKDFSKNVSNRWKPVAYVIEFLMYEATYETEIFGVEGETAQTDDLLKRIREDNPTDLHWYAHVCVGQALVRLCKKRGPLLPFDVYLSLLHIAKKKTRVEAKALAIVAVIEDCNHNYRAMLTILFDLLKAVAMRAKFTQMSSKRLAAVWAPNLLFRPAEEKKKVKPALVAAEAELAIQVVTLMIDYSDDIFGMPVGVKPKAKDTAVHCKACRKDFGLLRAKRNCELCGNVFCKKCTPVNEDKMYSCNECSGVIAF